MRKLSFRQIEAFRAVALTGSISRGADYLGVTQPAVSRLIRDLEHHIGMTLFERHGNAVKPNADAHLLYREVERHFLGIDQINVAIRHIRDAQFGSLRIACHTGASTRFMPNVIANYLETHPDADVTLDNVKSETVLEGISLRRYDIGMAHVLPGTPGIDVELLKGLRGVCAVPADHPLASRPYITPEDLRSVPLLSLGNSSPLWAYFSAILLSVGATPRIIVQGSASETLITLVALGRGIAIIDPFTAFGFANPKVVLKSFEPILPYAHYLIFPSGASRSRIVEEFASLIRKQAGDLARQLAPWPAAGSVDARPG